MLTRKYPPPNRSKNVLLWAVALLLCVLVAACILIWVYSQSPGKDSGASSPEYMLEILLEQHSPYELEYLKFGVALSDDDLTVMDDYRQPEDTSFHFLVGYRKGTIFFFQYKLKDFGTEETFYFDLDDLDNVYNPQTKKFEISSDGKIISSD